MTSIGARGRRRCSPWASSSVWRGGLTSLIQNRLNRTSPPYRASEQFPQLPERLERGQSRTGIQVAPEPPDTGGPDGDGPGGVPGGIAARSAPRPRPPRGLNAGLNGVLGVVVCRELGPDRPNIHGEPASSELGVGADDDPGPFVDRVRTLVVAVVVLAAGSSVELGSAASRRWPQIFAKASAVIASGAMVSRSSSFASDPERRDRDQGAQDHPEPDHGRLGDRVGLARPVGAWWSETCPGRPRSSSIDLGDRRSARSTGASTAGHLRCLASDFRRALISRDRCSSGARQRR